MVHMHSHFLARPLGERKRGKGNRTLDIPSPTEFVDIAISKTSLLRGRRKGGGIVSVVRFARRFPVAYKKGPLPSPNERKKKKGGEEERDWRWAGSLFICERGAVLQRAHGRGGEKEGSAAHQFFASGYRSYRVYFLISSRTRGGRREWEKKRKGKEMNIGNE